MRPDFKWMSERYKRFRQNLFSEYEMPEIPIEFYNPNSKHDEIWLYTFNKKDPAGQASYRYSGAKDDKTTRSNFEISMNVRYNEEELNLENTLIHEMCHILCDFNGFSQGRDGHSEKWSELADEIAKKSDGKYQISQYVGDNEMLKINSSDSKEQLAGIADRDGYYVVSISGFQSEKSYYKPTYEQGESMYSLNRIVIPLIDEQLAKNAFEFYSSKAGKNEVLKRSGKIADRPVIYTRVIMYHVDPEYAVFVKEKIQTKPRIEYTNASMGVSFTFSRWLKDGLGMGVINEIDRTEFSQKM